MIFHTKKGKAVDAPVALAPLADTHGHLTAFRTLSPDQAVERAARAGVRLLVVPVDPADDVEDAETFLSWFAEITRAPEDIASWPEVYFVAGVHPYGAKRFLEDGSVRERLERLLDSPRCVGVGEFGIDYGPWNELPGDVQIEAFRVQLRMAHERHLPVELHLRDATGDEDALAHQDALRVLQEEGVPVAGCDLHCFTSGPEVMRPFVELGCHIAFGGAVTFAKSDAIRAAAAACPEHLLLSETDSPYMAPVPLRGQECEPAMVAFAAACLADVRAEAGVAAREQTYEALWHNARAFFNLG